ncbi:lasso peptide biosynthesis B2 protein [Sporolactobacillus shoreicorticis]|uniref:Lasso peptide biosynthesis B2 protein n=1 Tax=Sporolactobacillus shoreicorticis TaxID=1923877 RepID=A0ABW5S3I0_9BACL|nr:lasso peptide biosynthesis B2 protein [Sporolactobacillus shoreicorticis]MCO7124221.1 lasso peptide biosynthesis B2 protein [Sporolactobacillus shoreicorticis]
MLKKIRKFINSPWKMKGLYIEAFFYLGWARLLILRPFAKINKHLGVEKMETPYSNENLNQTLLKKIAHAVQLVSRHTPWKSMCLVQAITAQKMLERRNIESTIYLGTGRDSNGKMIAHAWLRAGCYYLTGAEVMSRFIIVDRFAKVRKNV